MYLLYSYNNNSGYNETIHIYNISNDIDLSLEIYFDLINKKDYIKKKSSNNYLLLIECMDDEIEYAKLYINIIINNKNINIIHFYEY
jgi:hypothetical protein